MISYVPTIKGGFGRPFFGFVFLKFAGQTPAARYKRQVIRYKRQAKLSFSLSLVKGRTGDKKIDKTDYIWDDTYITSKTIGGKNDKKRLRTNS